jgi:hypothetical protein
MSKKKKTESKKTELVPLAPWEWLVSPVSAIYHDAEKY